MDAGQLLLSVFVTVMGLADVKTTHTCDQCDCILSGDDTRSVINVKPICSEGKITWSSSYGAIRLELHPGFSGEFRACIILNSDDVKSQVSQEFSKRIPGNYKLKIVGNTEVTLLSLFSVEGRSKEYCVTSQSEPVRLYIETERTSNDTGLPRVKIHYDIERTSDRLYYNPIEECRPCTDQELLRAFCSSDFVAVGTMNGIFHNKDTDQTHITVAVSKVIQQKGKVFSRKGRDLQGIILAPVKCGIRKGPGEFLFTGRVRLGQPILRCAPFLDQWKSVAEQAVRDDTMECSLD